MGVPLEWNVVMIYGAWVLFGVHADVAIFSISSPVLVTWLFGVHILLPLYGSVRPAHVSFLLSMRYYAGNWAWSIWLFRPEALARLDARVTKVSAPVRRQLTTFFDEATTDTMLAKVPAWRAMHLHGRLLQEVLPLAVDDLPDRIWYDGEMVTGMVLGWNFAEGHLNQEQLLDNLQSQCGFEPGDVRAIFVESEPLLGGSLAWRVADAATGPVCAGETTIACLKTRRIALP